MQKNNMSQVLSKQYQDEVLQLRIMAHPVRRHVFLCVWACMRERERVELANSSTW